MGYLKSREALKNWKRLDFSRVISDEKRRKHIRDRRCYYSSSLPSSSSLSSSHRSILLSDSEEARRRTKGTTTTTKRNNEQPASFFSFFSLFLWGIKKVHKRPPFFVLFEFLRCFFEKRLFTCHTSFFLLLLLLLLLLTFATPSSSLLSKALYFSSSVSSSSSSSSSRDRGREKTEGKEGRLSDARARAQRERERERSLEYFFVFCLLVFWNIFASSCSFPQIWSKFKSRKTKKRSLKQRQRDASRSIISSSSPLLGR